MLLAVYYTWLATSNHAERPPRRLRHAGVATRRSDRMEAKGSLRSMGRMIVYRVAANDSSGQGGKGCLVNQKTDLTERTAQSVNRSIGGRSWRFARFIGIGRAIRRQHLHRKTRHSSSTCSPLPVGAQHRISHKSAFGVEFPSRLNRSMRSVPEWGTFRDHQGPL